MKDIEYVPITLIRIIDNFILSGWKSNIKIAMKLLNNYESDLMKLKYENMLQFLINDMLKGDFFTEKNITIFEDCIAKKNISKKLINSIENEYAQEEKIKEIENNNKK